MKTFTLWGLLSLCVFPFALFGQTTYVCGFDDQVSSWLASDTNNYTLKQKWEERLDRFRTNTYLSVPLDPGGLYSVSGLGAGSGSGCSRANFVIPIVFHVVYDPNDTITNISDAQVQNQLDRLNDLYAGKFGGVNTGIQFCLAKKKPNGTAFSGINHIADASPEYRKYDLQKEHLASLAYYDREKYLNIWIVKDILNADGSPGMTGGHSNISYNGAGIDGIVLLYNITGNDSTCSGCPLDVQARGKALAHEIGHYLGLHHTFIGGCLGHDSATCATGGDHCCDTRPHINSGMSCLPTTTITCTNANGFYGNQGDPVRNIMNYVPEDCMLEFTVDQMTLMYATLSLVRPALCTVDNMIATDISCCMNTALFAADFTFRCKPDSMVQLKAYPYSSVTHIWKIYRNDTLLTTYSNSSHVFIYTFPDQGKYDVSHALVFNSGNDTTSFYRINKYLEYVDCGANLPSTRSNWFFGYYAGLRFTTKGTFKDLSAYRKNPTGRLTLNTEEGILSYSKSNGNLLFYGGVSSATQKTTSEMPMYAYNHKLMVNSPMLTDAGTPLQAGVVIPFPYDTTNYFICTVSGIEHIQVGKAGFLAYSVVVDDTILIQKGIPVKAPPGSEYSTLSSPSDSLLLPLELINAVPKCNGNDHWLLVVDGSGLMGASSGSNILAITGAAYANRLKIQVYSVEATGIFYHSTSDSAMYISDAFATTLKVSPDGSTVVVGHRMYRFDRITGTLTWLRDLHPMSRYFGGAFSPNSKIFYALASKGSKTYLYQYDLLTSNSIDTFCVSAIGGSLMMQLGPDGKLYMNRYAEQMLAVINYPDSLCSSSIPNACGFEWDGIAIADPSGNGGSCLSALPNFVDAKKKDEMALFIYHRDTACTTIKFSSNVCCANVFKWYFGDGDSSEIKEPQHTYSSTGTYNVTLIADLDTIYDVFPIGTGQPTLGGPTISCDTVSLHNYSLGNPSEYFSYAWAVIDGSGTPANYGKEIDVRWTNTTGSVKVVATDYRTGCKDSASKSVVLFSQAAINITPTEQTKCLGPQETLVGLSPGIIDADTPVFEWYRGLDTTATMDLISGAEDSFYLPVLPPFPPLGLVYTYYYYRTVTLQGCSHRSNIVSVKYKYVGNNPIGSETHPCFVDSPFSVVGSEPTVGDGVTYGYQWQYYDTSTDTWTDISGATSQDVTAPAPYENTYVRRNVLIDDCIYSSDSVLLSTMYQIIEQPRDTFSCYNTVSPFSIGVSNTAGVHYTWQWKQNGNATPFSTSPGSPPYDHDNAMYNSPSGREYSEGDSVMCIVITPCGNLYSRVAVSYVNNGIPSFNDHPANDTITNPSGDWATFSVTVNTTADSDNGLRYYWQVSYDDGETWEFIPGANSSSYSVFGTWCMSRTKYRAAVSNGCSGYRYSNAAALYVPRPSSIDNDLMMKDTANDNGSEPQLKNIWISPDIWYTLNGNSSVWDYNNKVQLEYQSGTSGYIKVRVRNRGNSSYLGTTKLVVHWTQIATQEIWPKHWLATANNMYGSYYRGGVIDTVELNGMIGAGDSILIVIPWHVPNPANYGISGTNMPVCLLARLLDCPEKPYGMAYPEKRVTAYNAQYNRKIITKNFTIVDEQPGYKIPVRTGNHHDQAMTSAVRLVATNCDYSLYGTVKLNLDAAFSTAWYATGFNGSGFTVGGAYTVTLNNSPCDMWLTGIEYASEEEATVEFEFVPDTNALHSDTLRFDFDLFQFNEDSLELEIPPADGGVHIQLVLLPNQEAELEQMRAAPETIKSGDQVSGRQTPGKQLAELTAQNGSTSGVRTVKPSLVTFNAYPNPFSDELNVKYGLDKDADVTIKLYNMYGQLISTLAEEEFTTKGNHELKLNTASLSRGVYFVNFTTDGVTKTKKVVLMR